MMNGRDAGAAVAARVLTALSERDREALVRFYTDREEAATIQADLGLTELEFRQLKSRARDLFTRLWQRHSAGSTTEWSVRSGLIGA